MTSSSSIYIPDSADLSSENESDLAMPLSIDVSRQRRLSPTRFANSARLSDKRVVLVTCTDTIASNRNCGPAFEMSLSASSVGPGARLSELWFATLVESHGFCIKSVPVAPSMDLKRRRVYHSATHGVLISRQEA
jgi:hypothetical protein